MYLDEGLLKLCPIKQLLFCAPCVQQERRTLAVPQQTTTTCGFTRVERYKAGNNCFKKKKRRVMSVFKPQPSGNEVLSTLAKQI